MAEHEKYMLSKPAEWIDEVFKGAVVGTRAMPELSEQFKAQFRDNIGATSSDTNWQPKGYFDTVEELQATVTAPKPGDAYGVGLEPPYNIWVWDGLRGRWLNNGPIKGMDGKDGEDGEDGKDANVTKESIIAALGFTPADAENVGVPDGSIGTAQLADGAVTKKKLDPNLDLDSENLVLLWENASPTSEFPEQGITIPGIHEYPMILVYAKEGTETYTSTSVIARPNVKSRLYLNANYRQTRLFIYRSDSDVITFEGGLEAGLNQGLVSHDGRMIPTYIYGIKGVK